MNICLVSREYPTDDHAGGIGTYTEKTARALVALGQSVTVITESSNLAATETIDGVTVKRLARPATHRLRTVARARAVARAIAELPEPPDIVQACEHRAEASWYALRKPARTRLVTRLATPSFLVQELNSESHVGGARTRYYIDAMERWQTRHSDGIISLTDALAAIVCERWQIPRSRVTTIHNGVDFARRHAATTAPLPPELRGVDYLLYFGRLEERKGVHILAQALPAVLTRHPQLHVVFAGNNLLAYKGRPMQAFVEDCTRAFADRVHFYPRLPHAQLAPVLANSLLVTLPSLWEALGNVSLEALDMGKAVVATTGCGFSEIVEDGRSGVLVPPGDVEALTRALLSLLADRPRLRQMGERARARAAEFSLERKTRQLLNYYETLLRASTPRPASVLRGANGIQSDN
jgi:glycogen(starch) synthase